MVNMNNTHVPLPGTKSKPDPLKTPDIEDPNNYCMSCDFTFKSRTIYCLHLINVHHIPRDRLSKEPPEPKI